MTRLHPAWAARLRRAPLCLLVLALLWAGPVAALADTQTRVVVTTFAAYSASTPTTALVTSETLAPGDPNDALTSSFTYDGNGNRITTAVSGPNIGSPPKTSTTYDPSGRFPRTSTDAVGHTTTFTYDPALGLVTSQTDPNNLTTTWSYDAWGRKALEVRPDGNRTAYAYKLCKNLLTEPACPSLAAYITETTPQNASGTPNGPVSITYYDKLDRVVRQAEQSETNFTAAVWSFVDTTYDKQGRVTATTQPYYPGNPTVLASSQTYDLVGRVLTQTYADSSVERAAYSVYTKTTTDTLGRTTTSNSDSHVVRSVVDPAGQTTTYGHDAFGNVTSITDPKGNVTSAIFSVRGGYR